MDDQLMAAEPAPDAAPSDDAGAAKKSGPAPAIFPRPAESASLAEALGQDSFFLRHGLVDGWFIRRSDVLLVSFDNLASIGEYQPPQPWMQARAAKAGFSILGLLASRRDWYRNEDAPAFLIALRDAGFFRQFRRVVFIGASMGGFAALTLASLVPGAVVLAFSPQSTLAPDIVPFEDRYRFGSRKWDWQSAPLLDAAETAPDLAEAYLVYDPFTTADRLHVARIRGPNVVSLRAPMMGHRAIRQIKALGMLQDLIEAVGHGRMNPQDFATKMRARREHLGWQRGLLSLAEERGHKGMAWRAARRLQAIDESNRFARRFARRLRQEQKAAKSDAPPQTSDRAERRAAKREKGRDRGRDTGSGTGSSTGRVDQVAADQIRVIDLPGTLPPFTGEIETLSNALLVPERKHDQLIAQGVFYADGRWCENARCWIRAHRPAPIPTLAPDEVVRDLPGTHLYGGHFRRHFGHFLVDSTSRLWALGHLGKRPDSLIYLPYRGEVEPIRRAIRNMAPFFRLLGVDIPVQTFGEPQRVERLIVPELGFGWSERYAGSPGYRDYMQSHLNAAAPAEGGEKLYVSRARLPATRGGVLGEALIEENMARAGYEIFHPEKHPLEVQIARYKAAKSIVALDGSALHLAAFVMPRDGRVAMILRRSAANVDDYDLQFRSFIGITPDVVRVIKTDWVAEGLARSDFRSVGELDFAALFKRLKYLKYLPANFRPDLPGEGDLAAILASYQDKRGTPFRALQPGESHQEDEE
ncbi:DUF563 domain-containing protein [Xinfangfangia sp. D13-10-4-6]|uniref:glycosyltransferase family 61 protein n=1 Tax=Pseudogemmobacter hezensis TaxID=2737662 RepID=UPI0015554993|nr:glycosyltransferase family 61 protein [Pseudogemmobacter hezensis]NPD15201.1 DUF563 domain-containing protein [Pseudogemmobacter hezensis]